MSEQIRHTGFDTMQVSFFSTFVIVFNGFNFYAQKQPVYYLHTFAHGRKKPRLCFPVSITDDSNDAVWLPVYSLMSCDDKTICRRLPSHDQQT